MAGKRRKGKLRIDERAELEAFTEIWISGYDYFDDLAGFVTLGRKHHDDCPFNRFPRDRCDWCARKEQQAAAREVWQRLGGRFMSDVWPELKYLEQTSREPWALERWGLPR
jgi:hypothetical protein